MTGGAPGRGRAVAVVPLRDGTSGKSRLAAALDPAARRRSVVALARHVLEVLAASPAIAHVCVVTADVPFVREVLDGLPDLRGSSSSDRQSGLPRSGRTADVIPEPTGRPGLNAALDHARAHVAHTHPDADRLLVVHADLPFLTPGDVAAVLAHPAEVAVATDRHRTGTNLLALPLMSCQDERAAYPAPNLTAPAEFRFRFGSNSRAAHEAEASTHGLTCAVVHRSGTAADLDTLDDLAEIPAAMRDRITAP